jgi:uncharacterized membrane protein
MAVLDGLWLGVVARKFYRRHLGGVMAASPRWSAAILFYLLYAVGVWFFAVDPAVQNADPGEAARRGALLGLLAYGTYDLTNMATLKKWPLILTVVDMGWGAVMTAAVGWAATFVALQVG